MKISTLAAVWLSTAPAVMAQDIIRAQTPMQTFYIPLPEHSMFYDMFKHINSKAAAPVESLLSFTISTDNTVVWYDHWEDGYEEDVRKPTSPKTEIWGDGNKSNGCAPTVTDCTDENDYLKAGDSIVVQNSVTIPRTKFDYNGIFYDGGDMVQASYPITMVRGGYPKNPGSLMAGAVEVLDTDQWGYEFVAPAGTDVQCATECFEYSTIFVMAKEKTKIIMPDKTTKDLDRGRGFAISVKQGDKITADKPIQVQFITGDLSSSYELRWYSLMATEAWSNDYLSPVGDSYGKTKMILYNPGSDVLDVEVKYLINYSMQSKTIHVPAKSHAFTNVIPTGSGARLTAGSKFLALSLTDAEQYSGTDSDSKNTGGKFYDWGFPVVPVNLLTPQVHIGLGYGCTNNNCIDNYGNDLIDRSCVWLTAMEDAFVFIDYGNDGVNYDVLKVKQYEGVRIRDPKDSDMTGAIIFATKWDGNQNSIGDPNGTPVDIAAAWGQDPSVSYYEQNYSLDLGTVVLPFTSLRVTKVASDSKAVPGEKLRYTIRVANVGQASVKPGHFRIVDPELDSANYVANSTLYSVNGGPTFSVPDDSVGETPFPLDEAGLTNLHELSRRGGVHEVSFEVIVDSTQISKSSIINEGYVQEDGRLPHAFKVETPLLFLPDIMIQNTVYLGQDHGASCSNSVEKVTGNFQTDVTYCFVVTNTGNTILTTKLNNQELKHEANRDELLMPGESYTIAVPGSIAADLINHATVIGKSVFPNGDEIPNVQEVAASDPSEVAMVAPQPSVKIENTVLLGASDAISKACAVGGEEKVSGKENDPVTYCLKVTNSGNTYLGKVTVTDPILNDLVRVKEDGPLAPNATFTIPVPMTILESIANNATVVANPVLIDGTDIPNTPDVTDVDPSEVVKIEQRSGEKAPFTIPDTDTGTFTECMLPHWRDTGAKSNLQCTAKEVYLEKVKNDVPATCTEGEMLKVNINADIHFNSERYDPAFFVATDGGDALTGSCLLKGFEKNVQYSVVAQDDPSVVVGHVGWDNDNKGGNDPCGDVFIDGGGGGNVPTSIINADVKCTDRNGDGTMDIAVCFSWRVRGKDGFCTLTNDDADTQGSLADVFPATPSKCYCWVYEVEDIAVNPVVSNSFDVCL